MERYYSREPFGSSMSALICSTRGPTNVKKYSVTVLKRILTPPFVTVDRFSFVVSYVFAV